MSGMDYDEVVRVLAEELGMDYDEAVDLADRDFETALWFAEEAVE